MVASDECKVEEGDVRDGFVNLGEVESRATVSCSFALKRNIAALNNKVGRCR